MALPSGNSVALLDLLRIAFLKDDPKYDEMASRMSRTFAGEVRKSPASHTFFLARVDFAIGPAYNIALVGDVKEKTLKTMLKVLKEHYLPNAIFSLKKPSR